MRLFTHNFLQCHVRKCSGSSSEGESSNFPLSITDADIQIKETDFNADFIRSLIPKIDWPALRRTAEELKISTNIPAEMPNLDGSGEDDETVLALLREVHRVLMDHHIETGTMTCRSCGHLYPIRDGIPNMLLGEDEI